MLVTLGPRFVEAIAYLAIMGLGLGAYLNLADDEGAAWGHLAECLTATGDTNAAADAYLTGIDTALRNGHNGLAADYEVAIEALS